MVDSPPQKNDEQYPLLKVESGGGDEGRPPQSLAAPGCNVTCTSKRFWYERWPELISACWMTGMLLSIFVLVIYGLGTFGVLRKHPFFVMNCSSSGLDNAVFYHRIIERGEIVQFSRFSEYLSSMASQYSSLRFNVFFLNDDSMQFGYMGPRHSRIIKKLIPYHANRDNNGLCDPFNQRELIEFQLKYPNVNITVMSLSQFMAMTPLKYKWRTIPPSYLTFYARVYSVWKNGGIGIDLDIFSNQYYRHQTPDRRMTTIIKHYNKGTKPEEYANILNNIDRDEQNEFFRIFYGIVHQILNETQEFFKRSMLYPQEISPKPTNIRTHRNKREVLGNPHIKSADLNSTVAILNNNGSDLTIEDAPYQNTFIESPFNIKNVTNNESIESLAISTSDKKPFVKDVISLSGNLTHGNKSRNSLEIPLRNGSEVPHVLLFYDFSVFSDSMGPPYAFPAMQADVTPTEAENDIKSKKGKYFLSLSLEGSFIAAVSKQHPFLGHIISSGCQRMPPRFAVQDAIVSQCTSTIHDEIYCSNIYVF